MFVFAQIGGAVSLVAANIGALVAVVFLYLPHWFAGKRDIPMAELGWRKEPVKKGIGIGVLFPVFVLLPIFTLGYLWFYKTACGPTPGIFKNLVVPGACFRFDGFSSAKVPQWSFSGAEFVLAQFIVVALPEELFFRGFIHEFLERRFPPKWRVWGGGIGIALILSSILFALSHLVIGFDLRRLSVFFPALLFGWMRSATGSILAGTLAHGLSNIALRFLDNVFL